VLEGDDASTQERLREWLGAVGGPAAVAIVPLAGDVSARRYFRVLRADGSTRIAARYPRQLAAAQERFRRAADLLGAAGVRVPRIERDDPAAGLALLEDLGERTLYERSDLDAESRARYWRAAIAVSRRIGRLSPAAVVALGSPPLDRGLLQRELRATVDLYLAPRRLATPALLTGLELLCERLAAETPVPCHRDFMVRNLVPLGADRVGVLDFQDLRLGPPAYDLASLLNDSWFAPPELEAELVGEYLPDPAAREGYRRAVAQRALKAVGTFTAFAARGQDRHLPLVAPTLARAARQLSELPETAAAFAELRDRFAT
jgi:aminoglycoside/choline kinase family phosphotransferase